VGLSRDQVIAAIYETVIQPEQYDAFMKAWEGHIQAALSDPASRHGLADGEDALLLDPELQAHFTRAYDILEQIGRKTPKHDLAKQIGLSSGFSILARVDGVIVAMGKAAAKAVEGTTLTALDGMLNAGSLSLLQDLQATALAGDGKDRSVVLSTGGTPRHLIARIAQSGDGDGQGAPVIVIEALDFQWSDRAGQMLVTSFGLSRAEVEIVRNLMAGHTLRQIAAMTGRSEHTVRNQAKAVLAKTGAPGQVDLVRLVAFLINADSQEKPAVSGAGGLADEMMTMTSGLEMQVFQTGPVNGRPVIFLHGMLDGMSPLHFAAKELKLRGMRVFAPVRPGYGRSDPVANPDDTLDVFIGHVRELIETHNLKRPIILGYLAGGMYGYNLCSQLPDRLAGMVVVGGGAPVTRVSQLSKMPARQRLVAYTARYAPALLPFVLRAGIAQIDGKDVVDFMEALFPPGTHDHNVIERYGLSDLFRAGYRYSVQQGYLGFAGDSHHVVRDWGARLSGPSAPVIHLQGALDPVLPPASVEPFFRGRENTELRVYPDCGQMLFYEQLESVFAAIEELDKRG